MQPIICFGQQPNGFLPKRFFYAKLQTARKLQKGIGGKIIWFLHDADHDYREIQTSIGEQTFNFSYKNKIVRKWTPLAVKEITKESVQDIYNKIRHMLPQSITDEFKAVKAKTASAFCVEMYKKLGLLDDIEIISSFSPPFRKKADLSDFGNGYYYDIQYEGELVRAEVYNNTLRLHHGGDQYTTIKEIDPKELLKHPEHISPGRDKRFAWMQSVINCTHYIMGNEEAKYLAKKNIKYVELIKRDQIENANGAWVTTAKTH